MKIDLYQQITNTIVAQLEAGTAPWFKPWSENKGGSVNKPLRSTGQAYRGINILQLWCAAVEKGFCTPHWFTYRQASEIGAPVRNGEQGTIVVYAGAIARTETDERGEDIEKTIPFLKQYRVFNASQIDGLPEAYGPKPYETFVNERDEKAEAFFEGTGAHISNGGERAFFAPQLDAIRMPEFERFHDAGTYYSTLAHECVHWTGAEQRLNRKFAGLGPGWRRQRHEMRSEVFRCFELGLVLARHGLLSHVGCKRAGADQHGADQVSS